MVDWLKAGNGVVITGGASGIGLAAAQHFLQSGLNVLIADLREEALGSARDALADTQGTLFTQVCDVADFAQVQALQERAAATVGDVRCLMNNAGTGFPAALPWENLDTWKRQIEINQWGIVHGCQAFVPGMLDAGLSAAVINTGSKQGITNPPGNYAYNLSKAGVKAYTESLAHALRQIPDCPLRAHLLVPGFTYTGMIARFVDEKPPGAWTPQQVVEFLLRALARKEFYVLCPDNDTPRSLDERRIQWNTDDLLKNRSALSRWDPEFLAEYEAFVSD